MQRDQVNFTTSTVVPTYLGLAFTLNNFISYSDYLSVFDQYKIDWIEVWIESRAPQGTTVPSLLTTAIDFDDANTPTSLSEVERKQASLTGSSLSGRYFAFKPHMAVAAYSGTFTSYSNIEAGWIDSASPGVQHFGLKVAIDTTPVASVVTVTTRAHVSFRASGL
jgi:hypothetical protein